jgi:amidohydrolase
MALDRTSLDQAVDDLRPALTNLAEKLHDHPELAYEEHRACAWIIEQLASAGVSVEHRLGGLDTSFRARIGARSGPKVAILAEYDALPEIGHACGHNLIAAGAVGAFLALARQESALAGSVELIGTPAEEGGGGKIKLLNAGAFQGVDAAMMYHPYDRDILAHPALATKRVVFRYRGTPSHAAIAPWEGNSALTACLETFRLIDAQRVHFRDGVRVHGIVTNGGQAVNVIPERAESVFLLRAPTLEELERVAEIAERCARGAALACGVQVESEVKLGYKNMRNNFALARRFGAALQALGRMPRETDPRVGAGSTDMGDVSHAVPSIHPYLAICDEGEALCHEHAFAACARSERGFETAVVAAKAMARTAGDLLEDRALLEAVREEFVAVSRS